MNRKPRTGIRNPCKKHHMQLGTEDTIPDEDLTQKANGIADILQQLGLRFHGDDEELRD